MRAKEDNPFVVHCRDLGGELMACQLPGREMRRNEPRHRQLRPYAEDLFPVLAPFLQVRPLRWLATSCTACKLRLLRCRAWCTHHVRVRMAVNVRVRMPVRTG